MYFQHFPTWKNKQRVSYLVILTQNYTAQERNLDGNSWLDLCFLCMCTQIHIHDIYPSTHAKCFCWVNIIAFCGPNNTRTIVLERSRRKLFYSHWTWLKLDLWMIKLLSFSLWIGQIFAWGSIFKINKILFRDHTNPEYKFREKKFYHLWNGIIRSSEKNCDKAAQ